MSKYLQNINHPHLKRTLQKMKYEINKPKMANSCNAFIRDIRERLVRDKRETRERQEMA